MIFRKVNTKVCFGPITMETLFEQVLPGEREQSFDEAFAAASVAPIQIPAGDLQFKNGKTPQILGQDQYSFIDNGEYVGMTYLTCCAAVYFYCNPGLFAYHAGGGVLNMDVVSENLPREAVAKILYATPTILGDNKEPLDILASVYGKEKIVIVDGLEGFRHNVYTDVVGNLFFM